MGREGVQRIASGGRRLIAVPCLTTARSIKMSYKELIIPIAAALLIWQGGLSPVWIILAAIMRRTLFTELKNKERLI